jgi:hypothetical protein
MSMFESKRRRDIVKKQRLKYEKRLSTLDPGANALKLFTTVILEFL